jgi:hypothetical protein
MSLATVLILTRSCFRVADLAKGFSSELANEEIAFMILEGTMIILTTSIMTIFHPGSAFRTKWVDAGWSWKKILEYDVEPARGSDSVPSSLSK